MLRISRLLRLQGGQKVVLGEEGSRSVPEEGWEVQGVQAVPGMGAAPVHQNGGLVVVTLALTTPRSTSSACMKGHLSGISEICQTGHRLT